MRPEEMKLPEVGKSWLSTEPFRREWVMDPPPWIRLPDDLVVDIYRIKMNYLVQLTKIEMQIKELEGKMFGEIARKMLRT